MAPEIALGMEFNGAADMYSFGMILCEMITGREPSADFLTRTPQQSFALNEQELSDNVLLDCPEALQAMTLQCCDNDAAYRPSPAQCIEMLQVWLTLFLNAGVYYSVLTTCFFVSFPRWS